MSSIDETQAIMEVKEDIAGIKSDIKYIVKSLDEMKEENRQMKVDNLNKCKECETSRRLAEHIENTEKKRGWNWYMFFGIASLAISIGAVIAAIFVH